MYVLYSALLALALILSLPYWLFQMARRGKYRQGFTQRMGKVPSHLALRSSQPTIWVHAVSVGEVLAVSGLVSELRRRWPDWRIVISTTTDTGQNLARERFGEDSVFYFPLDLGFAIRPYLRAVHPQLVVIAETEFWPNFLRLARKSGACIAVVNARISDRSLPGYHRLRFWLPKILENVDLFLAQTWEDRNQWRLRRRRIGDLNAVSTPRFEDSAARRSSGNFALDGSYRERCIGAFQGCSRSNGCGRRVAAHGEAVRRRQRFKGAADFASLRRFYGPAPAFDSGWRCGSSAR